MSSEETIESRPGLFRRTFRDQWAGILLSWVVGMGVVAGLAYVCYVPSYKSASIVRIDPLPSALFGIETHKESFGQYVQTQVQLLKSPNILTAAATGTKVQNLPRIQEAGDVVQELKKVVDVNILPDTYLIEVSMTSRDPHESAAIVNGVVDAYLLTNEQWADGMTRNQIAKLEEYLRELDVKIEELERRWKEVVAKGDVNNLQRVLDRRNRENEGHRQVTIEQYQKVVDEMLRLHLELIQARAWVDAIKADAKVAAHKPDREGIARVIDRKFQADPEVMALSQVIMTARQKVEADKRITQNPDDPAVLRDEKKLEVLKRKYDDLRAAKSEVWKEEIELTSASQPNDRDLRDAETRVRELKVKEDALKKAAAELDVINQKPATDEVEVQLLIDKRESIKKMEEQVRRRLEQLLYEARGETRVRLVAAASASNKPANDIRPLLLWTVPLVTLFVAVGSFLVVGMIFGPRMAPAIRPEATSPEAGPKTEA